MAPFTMAAGGKLRFGMPPRPARRLAFQLLIGSAAALPTPILAAMTPITASDRISLGTIQTLLAGLGYKDVGDKKTAASIAVNGTVGYSYNVQFQPSKDGKSMVVYIRLKAFLADEAPLLPTMKMLEFNDTNINYFSLSSNRDGTKIALLNTTLTAGGLTPVTMRRTIDTIVSVADQTRDLWDPSRWTGAAGKGQN